MMKYIFLISLAIVAFNCTQNKDTLDLKSSFESPSNDFKLHTWWHWMQGNITKDGITKDLEAMKKNGVVQATILNIGLLDKKDFGIKRVLFNTPEWYDMFQWAMNEANRLEIKIGVHNSDGWSSSGGPWIKPEQSMKVITWNKTFVDSNLPSDIKLELPNHKLSFYKDIALFAVPTSKQLSIFAQSKPAFKINNSLTGKSLCDGSMTGGEKMFFGDEISISLNKQIEVSKIAAIPLKPFTWANPNNVKTVLEIFYSNDNKIYKSAGFATFVGYNMLSIANIKSIKGQYFKLKLTDWTWEDSYFEYQLAELELLKENENPFYETEIENINKKTAFTMGSSGKDYLGIIEKEGIASSSIINLTDKLNPDGTLSWKAPKGNWMVYRMGYTTTNAHNAPATKEGEGLECDKMDTTALNFHFSQFPQKLIEKAGNFKGNTLKFFLIDSWECGFQNWTGTLAQEFKKRRGYEITPFLPVIAGVNINSSQESEAFLYDFRKTIAELIEENYYGHFAKLCHKNKLEMHAEVIYGNGNYPPLDVLKTNSFADFPMFEFWVGHNGKTTTPEYTAVHNPNMDFPISAAFFYDKKAIGAEAYTAMAHYSETPLDLKPFGDKAFASGINQFILHSYAHQPFDSTPGFTLSMFGSLFNRNNPWYNNSKSWMDYHARVQNMLQQGKMQADILYYVGDQLPQTIPLWSKNIAPQGYNSHICNSDVLLNKLELKDKKLWYKNVAFSIIYLPENIALNLVSIQKLESFFKNGIIICGFKPHFIGSKINFIDDKKSFETILDKIWSDESKIYATLNNAIKQNSLLPDFQSNSSDSNVFLYQHRVLENCDIYFVANQTNESKNGEFNFRCKRKNVKIFDPITGKIFKVQNTKSANQTSINFSFKSYESLIFVFDDENEIELPTYPTAFETIKVNNLKSTLKFEGKSAPETIETTEIPNLILSANEKEKYFSGFINYTIRFDLNEKSLEKANNILLKFDDFSAAISTTLNGVDLGTSWMPSAGIDAKNALKATNILNVNVATTYRNRAIGDYATFGSLKNIWTTHDKGLESYLSKIHPLRTSGLIGSLTILVSK